MTNEDKDFLEGDGVDAALQALHDAITASVIRCGGQGIKAFSVIALTDIGAGVVNEGCICPDCLRTMIGRLAESRGAKVTLLDADECQTQSAAVVMQ